TVTEKALAVPAGALAERLSQKALSLRVPGVRHVDQLPDLFTHGFHHTRRTVAEQVAAPTREEVEVTVALGVPDVGPLAAQQADRVARVVGDHVFLEQVDDFWRRKRR